MKKINYIEILIWALTAFMLIMAFIVYFMAPEGTLIPMHWNTHGQVDRYGSVAEIFVLPIISIALNIMLIFLPKIDPKKDSYQRFRKAYDTTRIIMAAFMFAIMCITIYTAFFPEKLSVNRFVMCGTGILFCVLGNLMPKFKHNYFVGFKTPWTLADDRVWSKTHRLAGALWFWGGLLVALISVIFKENVVGIAMSIIFGIAGAVPIFYSYFIFRKYNKYDNGTN